MKRVLIESPYAGDIQANLRYLRACMRDCLLKDESPFASHALYTQEGVLRDDVPEERKLGIGAGFEWGQSAEVVAFYIDLGMSTGMKAAVSYWNDFNYTAEKPVRIEIRTLTGWAK